MYLKKNVLLLLSNIICVILLSLSQKYYINTFKQNETVTTETVETGQAQNIESSSANINIEYQIIKPAYVIDISENDRDILYRIVEAEAGGEDRDGKVLVANVVINRVRDRHFPDTVAKVVYQKSSKVTQFSPVIDGRLEKVKVSENTKEAVDSALLGEDLSKGALYFMARKYVSAEKVSWFDDNLTFLFSHGGHEFFYWQIMIKYAVN